MKLLLSLLLIAGSALGIRHLRGRADVVIRVEGGAVRLTRGALPPTVLHDLEAIARLAPEASGQIGLSGRGDSLVLRTEGLDEGLAQRIRNTLLLHRGRIG